MKIMKRILFLLLAAAMVLALAGCGASNPCATLAKKVRGIKQYEDLVNKGADMAAPVLGMAEADIDREIFSPIAANGPGYYSLTEWGSLDGKDISSSIQCEDGVVAEVQIDIWGMTMDDFEALAETAIEKYGQNYQTPGYHEGGLGIAYNTYTWESFKLHAQEVSGSAFVICTASYYPGNDAGASKAGSSSDGEETIKDFPFDIISVTDEGFDAAAGEYVYSVVIRNNSDYTITSATIPLGVYTGDDISESENFAGMTDAVGNDTVRPGETAALRIGYGEEIVIFWFDSYTFQLEGGAVARDWLTDCYFIMGDDGTATPMVFDTGADHTVVDDYEILEDGSYLTAEMLFRQDFAADTVYSDDKAGHEFTFRLQSLIEAAIDSLEVQLVYMDRDLENVEKVDITADGTSPGGTVSVVSKTDTVDESAAFVAINGYAATLEDGTVIRSAYVDKWMVIVINHGDRFAPAPEVDGENALFRFTPADFSARLAGSLGQYDVQSTSVDGYYVLQLADGGEMFGHVVFGDETNGDTTTDPDVNTLYGIMLTVDGTLADRGPFVEAARAAIGICDSSLSGEQIDDMLDLMLTGLSTADDMYCASYTVDRIQYSLYRLEGQLVLYMESM